MKRLLLSLLLIFCFVGVASAGSVKGYYKKNGTYVQPYQRTAPDKSPYNNYNYPGNYNPNTGKTTGGNKDTYLNNYYKPKSTTPNYGNYNKNGGLFAPKKPYDPSKGLFQ